MKRPRTSTSVFNPEKFLAAEKKKSELAMFSQISIDLLLPIAFSKERRRALIARLEIELPAVFYHGPGVSDAQAALSILKEEIAKELTAIRVAADRTLVEYLVVDVVRDPAWKRAKHRIKNA